MASIVPIRNYQLSHGIIYDWLSQNIDKENYIMDNISMRRCISFCLRFGLRTDIELMNRKRDTL